LELKTLDGKNRLMGEVLELQQHRSRELNIRKVFTKIKALHGGVEMLPVWLEKNSNRKHSKR